ncbi:MAG: hypothetical protein HUU01_17710 [Saprospiraceae bacterium]|nr:hypothetical protein [Saprospiraceae bacterium]
MTTLQGLSNLDSIYGDLRVSSNGFNMHDLLPLSRVTTVGGDLFIAANNGLYGLEGLEQLSTVGGDCSVSGLFMTSQA